MMIIFSDIHLTDESTAINVDPSAFERLGREIASNASQRGVTEIHVVLLGDIFDLVRTSYWMSHGVELNDRPWGGDLDPQTGMNRKTATVKQQFEAVLDGILKSDSGQALIQMLEGLPRVGRDAPQVTYVVGNHDRALNNFDSLQDQIRAAIPSVGLRLTTSVRSEDYGLLARHGHEWDDNCHGWRFLKEVLQKGSKVGQFEPAAYRVMAIGEPITAELMGGFIFNVASTLDPSSSADQEFLTNLKDVNNLRPMEHALSWIKWFTRGRGDARYTGIVRDGLIKALDNLLACSLAKRWDDLKPDLILSGDVTDHLDKARSLLKGSQDLQGLGDLIATATKVVSFFHSVFGSKLDDFEKGAQHEFSDGIQYVVYGHTHVALHDDFHAEQSGRVRLYINTGTYLPLVERALDEKSFARSDQMTMLFFYNEAESMKDRPKKGPSVDLWNGIRLKTFV
jgi:UDP-2,3-diacylglucosamine pyrophosphatase LpxH